MKQSILKVDLAETIGEFIQYWGFKSIHGRVWTMIYLSEKPISTPEIVESLCVSKGLVSLAINELLQFKLIKEEEKVSFGAQTYSAEPDVARVVRDVLRERELKILTDVESKISILSAFSPEELKESNICEEKLLKLNELTVANKLLLSRVISKKFNTMTDWIKFLKKASTFLKI
jgi:DNA-binding transcriptional regulator GbsR (MarR family)